MIGPIINIQESLLVYFNTQVFQEIYFILSTVPKKTICYFEGKWFIIHDQIEPFSKYIHQSVIYLYCLLCIIYMLYILLIVILTVKAEMRDFKSDLPEFKTRAQLSKSEM